ncbi:MULTISPECIES: STAS domain-containing protein [Synechocystis]|uniref:Anti-sigma factor antagonist n=1 Tax=Synechocystis salina LEGE 00031 TaxID=1828736 RepID=A0ABR9VQ56_9SYNC|nr:MULTISPECIES: STAS domain-containing protein [Synechocystis]MBD2655491.1 STAS domain-containing protein [Synechocystis sp. FACHB-383]MBE9242966.1 STAS domain-containing protein [Synechocystis salina LEGE 00041]MBE9253479.1 STAS domain-containing protein [Synechocystis salina LEGE 00031]
MPLTTSVDEPRTGSKQIHLEGSLDSQTSPELEKLILQVITPDIHCAILNFTHLEYISSAGLRVVLKLQQIMHKHKGNVCALGLQPQVKKVFEIVQAMPTKSIFASVEELDQYLINIQRKILNE